jgi:hypothetical protein
MRGSVISATDRRVCDIISALLYVRNIVEGMLMIFLLIRIGRMAAATPSVSQYSKHYSPYSWTAVAGV